MTEDPSGDLLPQVEQKYSNRFRLDASIPNTYYFFHDVTAPVRQAAGADGRELRDRQSPPREDFRRAAQAVVQLPAAGMDPAIRRYSPCPVEVFRARMGRATSERPLSLMQGRGRQRTKVTVWTNSKARRPAEQTGRKYCARRLTRSG